MNIKEHIEAGHYLKDDKGRALVPMRGGMTVTICATDAPVYPIVGWYGDRDPGGVAVEVWSAEGRYARDFTRYDLLPPPPRKRTVKAYALVSGDGGIWALNRDKARAEECRPSAAIAERWPVVELTGEYEEAWPKGASSKSTEA